MDEELLKAQQQLKTEMKAAKDEAAAAKQAVENMKKDNETSTTEIKEAKENLVKATSAIEKLNKDFEALKLDNKGGDKPIQTLEEAIEATLKSDNFTQGKTYEVKASTLDIVTPITNSQVISGVNMPRQRALAFMPHFTMRTVMQDKDTIVWIEGEYASNVGYVSEGKDQTTDDTVKAVEKSRKLVKISAKIKVTAEMYEDKAYIANMLQAEMRSKALLWFDKELYGGEGADADGKTDKVYGLKTHATAFSATKAGVAAKLDSPTMADLASAVKLQGAVIDVTDSTQVDAGGFNVDVLFINPVDAMVWRHTKDANGQYLLIKLSDGSEVMGGLRVVETTAIAANTMLAQESGLSDLYLRRNFEIKVGQEGNDMSKDMYTIVLFMRGQSLVKNINKPGIIYVSDIAAALSALKKATI